MEYYIKQTIKKMEMQNLYMLNWVSLYNTTSAFCIDNIRRLFAQIFHGSLKIKYLFFQYISILLFKESDNLLALNESREFWTSDIWDFDDGFFTNSFFWSEDIVGFFDKEINRERIEALFKEVKPFICNILEPEFVELFREEMNRSFTTGVFCDRKDEYLKKMSSKKEKFTYWSTTF